jgi:hypothetical protein
MTLAVKWLTFSEYPYKMLSRKSFALLRNNISTISKFSNIRHEKHKNITANVD